MKGPNNAPGTYFRLAPEKVQVNVLSEKMMKRMTIAVLLLSLAGIASGCLTQRQVQRSPEPERHFIDGETIAWVDASQMIRDGQVKMVVQYHTRDAILTTVEGTQLKTRQPTLDAAKHLVDEVDPTGKRIVYGTE